MKGKLFPVLLISCIIQASTISAQQWYHNPTLQWARDANAIHIFNRNSILLAGGRDAPTNRTFYTSTTFGLNWDFLADDVDIWAMSVAFVDTLNGVSVGHGGTLLKTINSGVNWSVVNSPVAADFNKVVYAGPQNLFAVGGKRYNDSLQVIIKSTDGGDSWNVVFSQPGKWLKSVYFTDSLHGVAVGDSASILKTIDGGNSWNPVTAPVSRDLNSITFVNDTVGFIVGGKEINDSVRTILKTTDGGNSWTILKDEPGAWLKDITFVNQTTGYVVGDQAGVLKTTNSGLNWNQETLNGSTGNESFNAIRFIDPDFGIVAGKAGQVFTYAIIPAGQVITRGVYSSDSTSATLLSLANTHGIPSRAQFVFGNDTAFIHHYTTYSVPVNSDSLEQAVAYFAGVQPNTLYFYYAQLYNVAGSVSGSVHHFYTSNSPYQFTVLPASNITGNSAQLSGSVNVAPVPLQLTFNYGTTRNLGSQIVASPSAITDSLSHNITALLSGLQPNTTYYYALVGTGFTTFSSDTLGFYTGLNNPVVKTYPASSYNDTSVLFSGTVENFRFPATVSFLYGLTPSLGNEVPGNPFYVNDTALHSVVQFAGGLQQQTVYYFCIKAVTAADTLYGDTLQVYCGHLYNLFNSLFATNVTNTSAQLNGVVDGLLLSGTLTFEYGTTPQFGNEIGATPGVVNDTQQHQISAQVTGLNTGTFYYYRLKAVTPTGFQFYSDTRQVFIGDNEIPNWDFEYWTNRIALVPRNWVILGKTAEQVPGHTGYGLKLNYHDVAVNSMFANSNDSGAAPIFIDGKPFHARPDSIWLYLNANEAPGDTPLMIIQLYSGPTIMAFNQFHLPANTGGIFQRVAFPISYSSGAMPDSIVIGVGPCLSTDVIPCNLGSTITVDDFGFSPSAPAVPNTDFEDWVSYSYSELESWLTSNIASTNLNLGNVPCVTESYYNSPNDHAAKIQNYIWNGNLLGAEANVQTDYFDGGPSFPVYGRHQTFNGFLKWFPVNGDSAQIDAMFYKHGQYVGGALSWFVDSIPTFTPFSLQILYADSLVIPDSASIQISAFVRRVHGTSTLFVDKLRFDNSEILSASELAPVGGNVVTVYPNPAQNLLTIESTVSFTETDLIELLDLNGSVVMELKPGTGNRTSIYIGNVNDGFYVLRVKQGNIFYNKKIAVVR